jgi:hypothetical protein
MLSTRLVFASISNGTPVEQRQVVIRKALSNREGPLFEMSAEAEAIDRTNKASRPLAHELLVAWWTSEATPRRAILIAASIGALANVLVFGLGHIFGTSAYWDLPQEDSRAYLFGYRYFLAEPWQWPVFTVRTMNVPYTKNIVFTDSIPLWALINKIIATVIPPWRDFSTRAYLGIWHLLVYMAQASVGVAILRAVGRKTFSAAVLGAFFFLAVPSFVLRYGHASLSAHCLTLTALYLYFRTPSKAEIPRRIHIAFIAQLGIAAMINPYHVAMSFALYVAAIARARSLRSTLVGLPVAVVVIGLCAGFAGFFSREAKVAMWGFDIASANMLSPFIPRRSVLFGDGRSFANVEAALYQYEGYDYMGLGFLLLLVLFLPRVSILGPVIRRHPFLFAVAVGLSIFSLSNHVWFGSHRIIKLDIPPMFHWVTEQYRSPGRFIWLPTYVCMVWLLRWGLDRFKTGWQLLVPVVLAVLQVVDGGLGDWQYVRGYTREPYYRFLQPRDAWRTFVQSHEVVEVHPPYDCILDGTPFIDHVSQEVQYYASEKTLPINGVYSARPTRDCNVENEIRRKLVPNDRTLYVLLPRVAHISPRFEALGANCGDFAFGVAIERNSEPGIGGALKDGTRKDDGDDHRMHGRVCSLRHDAFKAAKDAGAFAPTRDAPSLEVGHQIVLGEEGKADEQYLSTGWSWPEKDGRWSTMDAAVIVAGLKGEATKLTIASSIALCGARKQGDVEIFVNAAKVDTLHYSFDANDGTASRTVALPAKLNPGPMLIELHPLDIRSPRELGCNEDDRKLGVFVRHLSLE